MVDVVVELQRVLDEVAALRQRLTPGDVLALLEVKRREALEEAARVVESYGYGRSHGYELAAAIRALKDKP
jgi:hypothetical protein